MLTHSHTAKAYWDTNRAVLLQQAKCLLWKRPITKNKRRKERKTFKFCYFFCCDSTPLHYVTRVAVAVSFDSLFFLQTHNWTQYTELQIALQSCTIGVWMSIYIRSWWASRPLSSVYESRSVNGWMLTCGWKTRKGLYKYKSIHHENNANTS